MRPFLCPQERLSTRVKLTNRNVLPLAPSHPQAGEYAWHRYRHHLIPQPLSEPPLQPADSADPDSKERYAALMLSVYYPWNSRAQLLQDTHADCLWDALHALRARADLSRPDRDVYNFAEKLLEHAQSRAQARQGSKQRQAEAEARGDERKKERPTPVARRALRGPL